MAPGQRGGGPTEGATQRCHINAVRTPQATCGGHRIRCGSARRLELGERASLAFARLPGISIAAGRLPCISMAAGMGRCSRGVRRGFCEAPRLSFHNSSWFPLYQEKETEAATNDDGRRYKDVGLNSLYRTEPERDKLLALRESLQARNHQPLQHQSCLSLVACISRRARVSCLRPPPWH